MTYNADIHHRHSIRLRDYDYSSAGAYFVTICAMNRECLFGIIVDGEMRLNDAGLYVVEALKHIPEHFQHVGLDELIIMPNHLHAILFISSAHGGDADKGEAGEAFTLPLRNQRKQTPSGTHSGSLGSVIQNFKSVSTRKVNKIRNNPGCPVWQRNYYERVIRNEEELNSVREYIVHNPINWTDDEEYTARNTVSPLDAIMGKYPLMSSSEEFARAKQEEIDLEEKKFRRSS